MRIKDSQKAVQQGVAHCEYTSMQIKMENKKQTEKLQLMAEHQQQMLDISNGVWEAVEGVRASTEATTRAVKFVEGRFDKRETGPGDFQRHWGQPDDADEPKFEKAAVCLTCLEARVKEGFWGPTLGCLVFGLGFLRQNLQQAYAGYQHQQGKAARQSARLKTARDALAANGLDASLLDSEGEEETV